MTRCRIRPASSRFMRFYVNWLNGVCQDVGGFSHLGPVGIGLIFLWDDVKTRSIQSS